MRDRGLISVRRTLLDETFRSAWWRFVRLWRPMAWWTLLVWALVGVMLGPLSSAVLGHAVFRGDRLVVGNEDLLAWVLTTEGLAGTVSSLPPIIFATGAWAAGAVAMDAVLSFFGFSLSATVLTKFYYEDTDLHATAPPVALGLGALPGRVADFLQRWLHPRRALPALAVLLLISVGLSVWLLRGVPEEPDFVVTAHRAGAHLATENTLAALERSVEAGADFAEIDVQRTRDGVVVVNHDADLMRLAGDPRRIARTDYADLADVVLGSDGEGSVEERRLATLDEFLERAEGRIGLNIKLKYYGSDPQLARQVVEAVRARDMEEEVIIMSLSLSAVRRV